MENQSSAAQQRLFYALIAAVCAAGVYFRLAGLWDRGFIYSDGLAYWKVVEGWINNGYLHWYFAKPGHIFLFWLFTPLLGLNDTVPMAVSAGAGLITVWLLYRLGESLFSREAGLLAAAFLASSPWHIYYSRISGSSATSVFFWTLALCCYTLSRVEYERGANPPDYTVPRSRPYLLLLAAGLSMGYAFTCHYNMGLLPPMFLLFEAHLGVRLWRQNRQAPSFSRGALCRWVSWRVYTLYTSMLLPLLFFNGLHIYLRYAKIKAVPYDPVKNEVILSYFQQVFIQLKASTSDIWGSPSSLGGWLGIIKNNEGLIASALLTAGAVWAARSLLRERHPGGLILLAPPGIGLFFLATSPYTAQGRSFAFALPLMALMMAGALCYGCGKLKMPALAGLALALNMAYNLPLLVSQTQIKTTRQDVRHYMDEQRITRVIIQDYNGGSLTGTNVRDVLYSPDIGWTLEQVRASRTQGRRIQPEHLLAAYRKQDLLDLYRCEPVKTWMPRAGKSPLDFEHGNVARVWDLAPAEDAEKLTGLFAINDCFYEPGVNPPPGPPVNDTKN